MAPYLYYIGHSTCFLELGGENFLTDPLLTKSVSFLRRRGPVPPLPDFANEKFLPSVLISHAHRDHLHLRSLRIVGSEAQLFAPDSAAELLREKGFSLVQDVASGQYFQRGGVSIEVVSADHNGLRNGGASQAESSVGYILDDGERRIYFAGDTDLMPGAASEIQDIDIALLPISGWGPSLGEGHLGPETAAEQTRIINPRAVVPIYYGPFSPIFLPQSSLVASGAEDDFFRELYRLGIDNKLKLVAPGEFLSLDT